MRVKNTRENKLDILPCTGEALEQTHYPCEVIPASHLVTQVPGLYGVQEMMWSKIRELPTGKVGIRIFWFQGPCL